MIVRNKNGNVLFYMYFNLGMGCARIVSNAHVVSIVVVIDTLHLIPAK